MDQGFRLMLGTAPDEAKRLRNQLHAWLLQAGITGATRHDIAVAAHESFLNAVNHHLDDPDVNINVEGEITDTDVIVTVSKRSQRQEHPHLLSREDYSYSLIHALMSGVHVETDPDGSKITLQKKIEKGRSLGQPEVSEPRE
jgi:anti-sigma regulatory factor (Ser/Thr protein kinase)